MIFKIEYYRKAKVNKLNMKEIKPRFRIKRPDFEVFYFLKQLTVLKYFRSVFVAIYIVSERFRKFINFEKILFQLEKAICEQKLDLMRTCSHIIFMQIVI